MSESSKPSDSALPISRSALDRLGERLTLPGDISDSDRELLDRVLVAYDEVLAATTARVQGLIERFSTDNPVELALTQRIKTTLTIREKLMREKERSGSMGLKGMQDIAGIRITGDITLRQQDDLGVLVVGAFAAEHRLPRYYDRRETPSHGYRALHVVVHPRNLPVEVQIRTEGQDLWAQVVEKLGDTWGRGIRYGEGPPEPDRLAIGDDITRAQVWTAVLRWGEELHELETGEKDDEMMQIELDDLQHGLDSNGGSDSRPEETDDMIERIEQLKDQTAERLARRGEQRQELQGILTLLSEADWE